MKRAIQFVVGLAISGVLLWLALRGVDWQEAGAAIKGVAWWVYPAYFLQLTVTHVLRTWRWKRQVDSLTGMRMPFRDAFGMCCVSFLGTFLLPFRLGELIRPYLATQRGYGRKSVGLATVALERVLDGLVMTGFLAVILAWVGNRDVPAVISLGGYVALLVFGGALGVFIAAYRWRDLSIRFWSAVLTPISTRLAEKLLGMLNAFIEGLKSLPTVGDVAIYLGLTVAYWLVNGFGMWVLAQGMDLELPMLGAYFVLSCLVVGITIPAGPGNVGNFEYAIQVSLAVFGVGKGDGAAYAIWTHLFQMLHMVVLALPFLSMMHLPPPGERDLDDAAAK
ncbi:MAG: flippase-like domain-containing protein [Deltaproteobacteria bacterium]|nr:flippase-like domain-containing protein [Deltaproteobacteria bacterium]